MSSQEADHVSASSVTPGKGKGALDLGGSKGSEGAGHRAGKSYVCGGTRLQINRRKLGCMRTSA